MQRYRARHCGLPCLFLLALVSVLSPSTAVAQDPVQAAATASEIESLKPLINPTTIMVAQVDVERTRLSEDVKREMESKPESAPLAELLASLNTALSTLSKERVTLMVDVPFSSAQSTVRLLARQTPTLDLNQLNQQLAAYRFSPAVVQSGYIVTSPAGGLAESNKILMTSDALTTNHRNFSSALASVSGDPIQIAFAPPAYLWKTYEDLMPRLPANWGGISTTTITRGIEWASLGLDPAAKRLRVTFQSQSPAAAQLLSVELPKLMQFASQQMGVAMDGTLLSADKITVNGNRIEIAFNKLPELPQTTKAISQLLRKILDPLNFREKQQRFMQIALAIHNYVDAHQVLPPNQAGRRPDGTSNLSWRVHILPYLGEEKLYSEFHLNESWDSEHNLPLLKRIPEIFAYKPTDTFVPSLNPGSTTCVAPVGEGTIFGGNKPVQFGHVKDGLSNTLMFVEVKRDYAVPWTAPFDYEFPVADPAVGLESNSDGHFLCAMGDGSVHYLPTTLPKETLLHLFQMNDGQEIRLP